MLQNDASHVWAMTAPALDSFIFDQGRADLSQAPGPKSSENTTSQNFAIDGRVAMLTIDDVIVERASSQFWGGLGARELGMLIDGVAANSDLGALVLDISCPGGSVYGLPELADKIHRLGKIKPVVAVANSVATSGAFWLASAASEFYMTPSGRVGSVGVIASHVDNSQANERDGRVVTSFKSVPNKQATTDQNRELSETGAAELQTMVDNYHEIFVKSLAKYRGVSAAVINKKFGEGSVFQTEEALARGMVDGVATLDEVVTKLLKARKITAQRKAKASAISSRFRR